MDWNYTAAVWLAGIAAWALWRTDARVEQEVKWLTEQFGHDPDNRRIAEELSLVFPATLALVALFLAAL